MPYETTETRLLPCKLTREEVEQRAQHLVGLLKLEANTQSARKAAVFEYTTQIKDLKAQIDVTRNAVENREEERRVDVVVRRDDLRNAIEVRRLDTNEVVEDRPMTDEERQLTLDNLDPPAKVERTLRVVGAEDLLEEPNADEPIGYSVTDAGRAAATSRPTDEPPADAPKKRKGQKSAELQ